MKYVNFANDSCEMLAQRLRIYKLYKYVFVDDQW